MSPALKSFWLLISATLLGSSFVGVAVAIEREFKNPCFTLTGDVVLWALGAG